MKKKRRFRTNSVQQRVWHTICARRKFMTVISCNKLFSSLHSLLVRQSSTHHPHHTRLWCQPAAAAGLCSRVEKTWTHSSGWTVAEAGGPNIGRARLRCGCGTARGRICSTSVRRRFRRSHRWPEVRGYILCSLFVCPRCARGVTVRRHKNRS